MYSSSRYSLHDDQYAYSKARLVASVHTVSGKRYWWSWWLYDISCSLV